MIAFRILLSFVVLAGATVFMARHSTLRQLNSERSRIEQQIVEWSNRRVAAAPAEGARSVSTNAGISTAEHSELLRLRGQIGVLRRDLAEETNQPAAATGAEAARAAHGTLHGQADVTAAVKALVAGGTNSIAAGNHLFGEDPASGVVKRLRVEFELDGRQHTSETTERGTLEIPAGAVVLRATYGDFPALEPNQDVLDVTAKVSAMVASGETSVKAANALVGLDPAPMIGKMLRVELRVDGAPLVIEADEGKTVDIPPGAEVVQAVYGNLRGRKRSSP
ncbi:MAG: hypothetical protein ACLQVX_24505 [Limisphaerales bacterium]